MLCNEDVGKVWQVIIIFKIIIILLYNYKSSSLFEAGLCNPDWFQTCYVLGSQVYVAQVGYCYFYEISE